MTEGWFVFCGEGMGKVDKGRILEVSVGDFEISLGHKGIITT